MLKRRLPLILIVLGVLLLFVAAETYSVVRFYGNVSASRRSLLSIKEDLDLTNLQQSEPQIIEKRQRLQDASGHLRSAKRFVKTDPLIAVASPIPVLGKQVKGLKALVIAADEATRTGLEASDVALAFARYERDPNRTSIEAAIAFLRSQEAAMAAVDAGYRRLSKTSDGLPGGLMGPLGRAKGDLESAVGKLEGLVEGYNRADRLLPELLGYDGPRRYLVLPQNDTELFPSGGLISSYGIATFEGGRLVKMDLEYFGTLYDRWQAQSRGEYIEPPGPLKNYLKRNYSWALGEAGWYPDFPKTADLARSFVQKGGAPATDGTIAIDLQFISALLELLGPVEVPDYRVTVTPENVNELTLELTRDENYVPGQQRKAFLSFLSRAVINQIYAAPKERWVDLLRLLDRMARERHLQLNFADASLQGLIEEYGFDGSLTASEGGGDFLLLADTSVNSTKLNLILDTRAQIDLQLLKDGTARSSLTYEIQNPFPEWRKGRDPRLVTALMLEGVYGCYLRVYTSKQARLLDLRLDGKSAGAEQIETEMDRRVFGRFFPVLPGAKNSAQFVYETPSVAKKERDGRYHYRLYVQKEAGTKALPLAIRPILPRGASLKELWVDGRRIGGTTIETDLQTDRQIEIVYTLS